MAFPTLYNYLSRIGALWPMLINGFLRVAVPTLSIAATAQIETLENRF
jgi:hypothetical protein